MSDGPSVEFIEPETLRAWIETGEAVIVDVREPHEYAQAHIEGSMLIPLSTFDPTALPAHDGKKLVIHCASGVRCGVASQCLLASGFTGHIHRLAGGIQAWYHGGGLIVQS
jgi:rhodanese-related sulfurtransferase